MPFDCQIQWGPAFLMLHFRLVNLGLDKLKVETEPKKMQEP